MKTKQIILKKAEKMAQPDDIAALSKAADFVRSHKQLDDSETKEFLANIDAKTEELKAKQKKEEKHSFVISVTKKITYWSVFAILAAVNFVFEKNLFSAVSEGELWPWSSMWPAWIAFFAYILITAIAGKICYKDDLNHNNSATILEIGMLLAFSVVIAFICPYTGQGIFSSMFLYACGSIIYYILPGIGAYFALAGFGLIS